MDGLLKKININNQLYMNIIIKDNDVYIQNANFPVAAISIEKADNIIYIYCCEKEIASVDLENEKIYLTNKVITTTEVRSFAEYKRTNAPEYKSNNESFYNDELKTIPYTMELHTHFMEVLNAEEFLQIIFKYIDYIPIDKDGNICLCALDADNPRLIDESDVYAWYDKHQALNNEKILSQLRLPTDRQLPFEAITPPLLRRNGLIDLIGYRLSKDKILELEGDNILQAVKDLKSDSKAIVYTDILIESLEKHKKQGVKYVEFSYSNPNTIIKILEELNRRGFKDNDIKFKFLLSEDRKASGKPLRKSTNKLKELLKDYDEVVGFDLMGFEKEILPFEFEETNGIETLYDKLKLIVNTLLASPREKTTLRLHSGEIYYDNPNSLNNNPLLILKILKKIEDELGIDLSTKLDIRIGHGLHFQSTDEYFELLKHFNVIVEICISSNFALGNIKDLKNIPINEYIKHNIPVVLGTDGGGFYLTTLEDEERLAGIFAGTDSETLLRYVHDIEPRFDGPSSIESSSVDDSDDEISEDGDYYKILSNHKDDFLVKSISNSNAGKAIIKNYFSNDEYKLDFQDSGYYPIDMDEKSKVRSEYISLLGFYHDKIINEAYFDSNQLGVIMYSLYKIKNYIDEDNIIEAALTIVSLQRLLKMDIRLEKVLLYMVAYDKSYEDYVDIYTFFGKKKEQEDKKENIRSNYKQSRGIHGYINNIIQEEIINTDNINSLYEKYTNNDLNNGYRLDLEERKYFDNNLREEDKILIEYQRTIDFIKKKATDGDFTNNQLQVIEDTLEQISDLYYMNDLIKSAESLISLQVVLNMKIKLEKVLFLMDAKHEEVSDYLDIYKYYGNDYNNGKGKK